MKLVAKFAFPSLALALSLTLAGPFPASAADNRYAPQPQAALKLMLSIDWKKGPDLPQGFQDSAFGIVHNALVTAGGFCQGSAGWANHKELDREKPGRYPRGFLNKAWSLDLAGSNNRWVRLPDFPAVARQGFFYTVADDQLYWCGGFNYSQPYCYRDGFRLKRDQGRWSWEALPPLPWAISCGGMNVLGSKIYLLGGADYDANKFHTNSDRAGNVKRLGARLLTLDTKNLAAGWKELSPCPGTPRFCQAVAGVGGKLFVIGGAAGDDNPTQKYANVVDNWQYDPTADSWQRLRDMPVSSSNFPSGRIVAFDRYILLVGGYQYGAVIGPDGKPKPIYGKPFKHYPNHDYYSDIFVYDAKLGQFGTATPLPLNNAGPMTAVQGDRVYMIGGETGGSEIEGEPFGHHPDLYLIGTIREINP